MKIMLVLTVLIALALEWFHQSELAVVRAQLAAARDTIRVVEQQRAAPRADIARVQAVAAAAQERVVALEQELRGTQAQLAATQGSIQAAARQLSALRDNTPEAGASAGLVKGTYTLLDDTVVYSADAQLKIGKSVLVSSPNGVMLSDREIATVAGDLAVETPSGTMQTTNAFIDVNDGKIEMKADSMTFTNK
jgi:hypothetical protein